MILSAILLIISLVFLIFGADYLIKSSCVIANRLKVSPLVVGLTVVAFGTSAPELFVSSTSALKGNADFAIGNVVGSNIFNFLGILGIALLFKPLKFSKQVVYQEMPIMLFALGLFYLFALSGQISRVHGVILFLGIIVYIIYLIINAKSKVLTEEIIVEQTWNLFLAGLIVVISLAVMILSANVLVDNAVVIAKSLGVSDLVIGVTILAVGTSLPELAATYASSKKGQADIAIGNVVGSNIFNVFTVIGITAMIAPLNISPASLKLDFPMMFFVCLLFWIILLFRQTLTRTMGVAMLLIYACYVFLLVKNGAI